MEDKGNAETRQQAREGCEMAKTAGMARQTRSIARGLGTAEEETASWGCCIAAIQEMAADGAQPEQEGTVLQGSFEVGECSEMTCKVGTTQRTHCHVIGTAE